MELLNKSLVLWKEVEEMEAEVIEKDIQKLGHFYLGNQCWFWIVNLIPSKSLDEIHFL